MTERHAPTIAEVNSMIKDSASSAKMRNGIETRLTLLFVEKYRDYAKKGMVWHSLHMIPPERDATATEIHSLKQTNR